ncbi:MAG: LuxR family transcriptional regulator [Ornithinimicrobium sp.]
MKIATITATDLSMLGGVLLADAHAADNGRAVEVVIDQPGQRVIAMGIAAGSGLPEHDAPPAACLQVCQGEVTLIAGTDEWTLAAGHLVQIPHRRHHLEAAQDTFALLTITTPR